MHPSIIGIQEGTRFKFSEIKYDKITVNEGKIKIRNDKFFILIFTIY